MEPTRSGPSFEVKNIVTYFGLGTRNIDLHLLGRSIPHSRVITGRFNTLVCARLYDSDTVKFWVYTTGKVIQTGVSLRGSYGSAKEFVLCLRQCGYAASLVRFRVANVVRSANLGFSIGLGQLYLKHSSYCSYNPEKFPGLKYKIEARNGESFTLTIFSNGQVNLLCKRVEDEYARNIIRMMMPHFEHCRIAQ